METKICTKCGEEKPATFEYFYRQSDKPLGLRCHCKKCMQDRLKNDLEYRKRVDKINRKSYCKSRNIPYTPIKKKCDRSKTHITCTSCNETFPADIKHFHKQKHGYLGFHSQCRKCINLYRMNRYHKVLKNDINKKKREKRINNPVLVAYGKIKKCRNCQEKITVNLHNFFRDSDGIMGVSVNCKKCDKFLFKKRMQNPDILKRRKELNILQSKKNRSSLNEHYIAALMGTKVKYLNSDIIETKRLIIKIKRVLKTKSINQ